MAHGSSVQDVTTDVSAKDDSTCILCVKTLTGNDFKITMQLSDEVQTLKEEISKHLGCSSDQLILYLNGKVELKDIRTLKDCDINESEMSTVYAILKTKCYVFVKSTTLGADCVIEMQPLSEMRLLKVGIASRVGHAADELKFLCDKKELPSDECSPEEYGIKKGSTITVVLKSEGYLYVEMRRETFVIHMDSTWKITMLKAKIASRMKIKSSDELQVFYRSEELTDDQTLRECGIKNGSTIKVQINPDTVFVNTCKEDRIAIQVDTSLEDIASLKRKIAKKLDSYQGKLKVLFYGKECSKDERILKDDFIKSGSTVCAVLDTEDYILVRTSSAFDDFPIKKNFPSLSEMKITIAGRMKCSPKDVSLLFNGEELTSVPLDYAHNRAEVPTVEVVLKPEETVFVNTCKEDRIAIQVDTSSDDIASLKGKIAKKLDSCPSKLKVIFDGKECSKDERILKDDGIKNGSTVCAVLDTEDIRDKNTPDISFIDEVATLEIDSDKAEYAHKPSGVILKVPKGALSEGKKVSFEIGIADPYLGDPFEFPKDTLPISKILWIHPKHKDIELQKDIDIVLPLVKPPNEDSIHYFKASRQTLGKFKFEKMPNVVRINGEIATVSINHFCALTVAEDQHSPSPLKYCLQPVWITKTPASHPVLMLHCLPCSSLKSVAAEYDSRDSRILHYFEEPKFINGTTDDNKKIVIESADTLDEIDAINVKLREDGVRSNEIKISCEYIWVSITGDEERLYFQRGGSPIQRPSYMDEKMKINFMTDVFQKSLEKWVQDNVQKGYKFHKLLDAESVYTSVVFIFDDHLETKCIKSDPDLLQFRRIPIGFTTVNENRSDILLEKTKIFTLTSTCANEVRTSHATSDECSCNIEFPIKLATLGIAGSHTERQETTIVNRSEVSLSDRVERTWYVKPWRREVRIPLLTRRVYNCTLQNIKVRIPKDKMLQIKVTKSKQIAQIFNWYTKKRKKRSVSTSDLFTYDEVIPDSVDTKVNGCVKYTVWDIEMKFNHSKMLPRQ